MDPSGQPWIEPRFQIGEVHHRPRDLPEHRRGRAVVLVPAAPAPPLRGAPPLASASPWVGAEGGRGVSSGAREPRVRGVSPNGSGG
eukprot:8915483-Alexandrium_andersonii.AAC.1